MFYLKTNGIDTLECVGYKFACRTIDHVMKNIVNATIDCAVYIDVGTYNYTLIGNDNNPNGGYSNRSFTLFGYVLGSFVDADNINTYPVILFDVNNANTAFEFYMNINASFIYVRFYCGSNSNTGRRIFMSLLIYYCYYFILFCGVID
jgi:hypothetical protein